MTETVIEKEMRLSESLLWTLQYKAYCQFGVGAWSRKGVPSYITSNAYTSKSYAHVALGYLKDLLTNQAIDVSQPVYLFDLGAGTGRFAYLFLKQLFQLIGKGPLSQIKLCYVMTDIAEDNIAFWQKHPYLKPYYDQGVLDCAKFHHSQTSPLHLIRHNKQLTPDQVINPIIVIANYFFDTIPQDLFRVNNGLLEEGRITLFTVDQSTLNSEDPDIINHLKFRYSYHPLDSSSNYYQDKDCNAILEMYRKEFNDRAFWFPTGAIHVLRVFRELSGSRMLLLAGDQGVCTSEQVQYWGDPAVALHGTFSMGVSYHALGLLFDRLAGKAFFTSFSDPAFVVMGGIFNQGNVLGFYETELAFDEYVDAFEPTEYWRFITLTEKEWKDPPFNYLLMLVKLGNWDAMALHAFFPILQKKLVHATESEKKRLAETIDRIWENYYPVASEEEHFVRNLGTLLYEAGFSEQAATYFQRASQISTKKIVQS